MDILAVLRADDTHQIQDRSDALVATSCNSTTYLDIDQTSHGAGMGLASEGG